MPARDTGWSPPESRTADPGRGRRGGEHAGPLPEHAGPDREAGPVLRLQGRDRGSGARGIYRPLQRREGLSAGRRHAILLLCGILDQAGHGALWTPWRQAGDGRSSASTGTGSKMSWLGRGLGSRGRKPGAWWTRASGSFGSRRGWTGSGRTWTAGGIPPG